MRLGRIVMLADIGINLGAGGHGDVGSSCTDPQILPADLAADAASVRLALPIDPCCRDCVKPIRSSCFWLPGRSDRSPIRKDCSV